MEIVIATHNLHKIREFRDILKPFVNLELLSLLHFPHYVPPESNEKSFQETATKKAIHAAQELQKWVIADESGLFVPALNGEPGMFDHRYAAEDATDRENRQKLLSRMTGFKDIDRSAYYECSIAISSPDGLKKCVTGTCEGAIIQEERGGNGYGYDPLFVKNDYDKTFAEIDDTTRNKISHRRKALEKLIVLLESLNHH